jgi:hypothetical protein
MNHLTDTELQLLADDEGTASLRAHVDDCAGCRAKLEERRRTMTRLAGVAGTGGPSPELIARVRTAVRSAPHSTGPARGATVLRPERSVTRRPVWVTALAAAAVIAIIAFGVLPRVDAPTTLSASQIIDRSLERMTGGTGIEQLEYELVMSSQYRRGAGLSEGPFRVVQVFDRTNPARFKFQQFDRDGVLVAATAQDPASSRRTEMVRVDGRDYIIHVTSLPGPLLSIPALLQSQGEAMLRMMQLNADPNLQTIETPAGPAYVIEMPPLQGRATAAAVPLDVTRARAVIDATDFRVLEFATAGTLLGQPFDVSFKLLTQEIDGGSLPASAWAIEEDADDVVIEGEGAGEFTDSLTVALREIGRTRGR